MDKKCSFSACRHYPPTNPLLNIYPSVLLTFRFQSGPNEKWLHWECLRDGVDHLSWNVTDWRWQRKEWRYVSKKPWFVLLTAMVGVSEVSTGLWVWDANELSRQFDGWCRDEPCLAHACQPRASVDRWLKTVALFSPSVRWTAWTALWTLYCTCYRKWVWLFVFLSAEYPLNQGMDFTKTPRKYLLDVHLRLVKLKQ